MVGSDLPCASHNRDGGQLLREEGERGREGEKGGWETGEEGAGGKRKKMRENFYDVPLELDVLVLSSKEGRNYHNTSIKGHRAHIIGIIILVWLP